MELLLMTIMTYPRRSSMILSPWTLRLTLINYLTLAPVCGLCLIFCRFFKVNYIWFILGRVKLFSSSRKNPTIVRNEKYANFHTIDWLRDLSKDRFRHRWIQKEKDNGKTFEKIQSWFEACSGWFCVLLIGLGAGKVETIESK